MLQNLSEKLQNTFSRLRNRGRLTEQDVETALREIRLALLEADVNFKVVREFITKIRERAVGAEVLKSLTPAQHVIKIVDDELVALLGGEEKAARNAGIKFNANPPTIIMMVGLQGTGKTTTCGKLALWMRSERKKPLLVACDVYRPAAVQQLVTVGEQAGVTVYEHGTEARPLDIARGALQQARLHGNDVVIIDTAGRLHIDEAMMDEIRELKTALQPHETLLVVDAMTGQDAVNAASEFDKAVDITGVVLTKLDGDARGGAVLSVRAVTGKPIKFTGVGEKLDALEPFFADRMASRILGMGDVMTLIEKAEQALDEEKARELEQKLRKETFDLGDFLHQMEEMKKMGPLENLIGMVPGLKAPKGGQLTVDEGAYARTMAIIKSMTPWERANPDKISGSRKRRIAGGSGTSPQQINFLLNQFREMRTMMKRLTATQSGKRRGMGMPGWR